LTAWKCRECGETRPPDAFPAPPRDGFAVWKVRA
jgi:hypothetical protein